MCIAGLASLGERQTQNAVQQIAAKLMYGPLLRRTEASWSREAASDAALHHLTYLLVLSDEEIHWRVVIWNHLLEIVAHDRRLREAAPRNQRSPFWPLREVLMKRD